MITAERLRELLEYCPETGVFRWRVDRYCGQWQSRINVKAGSVAGCRKNDGYIIIRVEGRLYRAHRLAFLWMTGEWPAREIDHMNLDRSDNRWGNLREATPSQNKRNVSRYRNNATGLKGVCPARRRFRSAIQIDGRSVYLGTFDTPEEAHAAYQVAALELHGTFARPS